MHLHAGSETEFGMNWAAAETATGSKKGKTRWVVPRSHSPRGWKRELARKENSDG